MLIRIVLPAVIVLLASAVCALPQETPTVRVTSRLVQLSVVVHDRDGRPVSDLAPEEFRILDGGRSQTIAVFRRDALAGSASRASRTLPADSYSNRRSLEGGSPSVTVILLDWLNTSFADQGFARAQILEFLSQIQSSDRVALYVLDSRDLRVVHDFTQNAASLVAAVSRLKGKMSLANDVRAQDDTLTGDADLDRLILDAQQDWAGFQHDSQVLKTTSALLSVARHLGEVPGRKNLVWVSAGFPIWSGLIPSSTGYAVSSKARAYFDQVERASQALTNANVAIYPVDARGLIGSISNRVLIPMDSARPGTNIPVFTTAGERNVNVVTLQQLADRTGGRAFYNSNDIAGAIRRAIDDSGVSYYLAYYPDHNRWNDRFREIKVEVVRPGLKVRHKRGYFALSDKQMNVERRQKELMEAVAGPIDASGVGLVVNVNRKTSPWEFEMEIDPGSVSLRQDGARRSGTLDFLFLQQSVDGRLLSTISQTVQLRLTDEMREDMTAGGLILTRPLEIVPEAQWIRIVVQDVPSGAIGSVRIPARP